MRYASCPESPRPRANVDIAAQLRGSLTTIEQETLNLHGGGSTLFPPFFVFLMYLSLSRSLMIDVVLPFFALIPIRRGRHTLPAENPEIDRIRHGLVTRIIWMQVVAIIESRFED